MNFKQTFPSEGPTLSYEITVPLREFVATMREVYLRAVLEETADAPYHQVGEWPLLDRLQDLDYPPLEQLAAEQPELLADLVREWLDMETLDQLLPGSATDAPNYIINSVDRIVVDLNSVRIAGQAYPHPALVPES